MNQQIFDMEKFNLISDDENYYLFRALNNGDNADMENGITLDNDGNFLQIRTDRMRYIENPDNVARRYSEKSPISLEQVYDHIKIRNRKDTNCISLTSNANVSLMYGRDNYKNRYIMVKIPKKELGEKVVNAGEYMLQEIEKRVNTAVSELDSKNEIIKLFNNIDASKTDEELRNLIQTRYTSNVKVNDMKTVMKKGIIYTNPTSRLTNHQLLNDEQNFEKNKILAKLTALEKAKIIKPLIPHTSNNIILIKTLGMAFSSSEQIHYGEIEQNEILKVSPEIVDIFGLLQQLNLDDKQVVADISNEVIQFVNARKYYKYIKYKK
ncbi:MAG: hypothetical protein LBL91_01225 [Lachnospiraceae bacterium]|jgi:hypothetical protein|nr:hypothetical protein [Lachnospiraceae bacterium]